MPARPRPPLRLPDPGADTRLAVVAPHPDDEVLGAGGLLHAVHRAGGAVRVFLLTRGEANPWPQRWLERRWRVDARAQARWGRRRVAESRAALRCLGPGPEALLRFDWPDLGLLAGLQGAGEPMIERLGAALADFAPSLVAFPALADRHPDHGAAHLLVRAALARLESGARHLPYLVHGAGRHADTFFPLAFADLEAKRAALARHGTQMALARRRLERLIHAEERFFTPVGARGTALSALPWRVPRGLRRGLQLSLHRAPDTWTEPVPTDGDVARRVRALGAPGAVFVRLSWRGWRPWIWDHWGWRTLAPP